VGGKGFGVVAEHTLKRQHGLIGGKHPVGRIVESGDDLGKARHRCKTEAILGRHAVVEPCLIESAHLQHPFDRLPAPSEAKLAVIPDSYRKDLEVKLRRGPRVDAELVQAGGPPLFQCREVDKFVPDRPLDLVSEGAGKKNHRGVGLDALYGCRRRIVGLRPAQEIQHFGLTGIGLSHGLTIARESRAPWATGPLKYLNKLGFSLAGQRLTR